MCKLSYRGPCCSVFCDMFHLNHKLMSVVAQSLDLFPQIICQLLCILYRKALCSSTPGSQPQVKAHKAVFAVRVAMVHPKCMYLSSLDRIILLTLHPVSQCLFQHRLHFMSLEDILLQNTHSINTCTNQAKLCLRLCSSKSFTCP